MRVRSAWWLWLVGGWVGTQVMAESSTAEVCVFSMWNRAAAADDDDACCAGNHGDHTAPAIVIGLSAMTHSFENS